MKLVLQENIKTSITGFCCSHRDPPPRLSTRHRSPPRLRTASPLNLRRLVFSFSLPADFHLHHTQIFRPSIFPTISLLSIVGLKTPFPCYWIRESLCAFHSSNSDASYISVRCHEFRCQKFVLNCF
ncbi:hypothetical protein Pfo_021644 [Paulownia fortunei]|nr:hypothetical protein Pfo_021644 [Paulownia fortunei]